MRKLPAQFGLAFSLIEVVLALGLISFALVAIMGLLPTALNSQQQAVNQAFGAQALNDVSQALQGAYTTNNGASYTFPAPLRDVLVGSGSASLSLYEDGSLTNSSVPRKGTVFVEQKPLAGDVHPVFISVAWAQGAARNASGWTNAQGSVSAFLYL
ncbi:MAG: hypothetical protein ACOYM3_27055, partial [Terrimicrobiaceae bacterium]